MKEKITKQDLAGKIGEAEDILIVTSGAPKVDQLTACVGLFNVLREHGKNPAIVYSKEIPGSLNFLEPEKVIQHDAESLRDFIISFDRAKVDKFRYNQEGDQYNILLTPSRLEAIVESDIKYRKGDFNIDLVLAVGVENKASLDAEIGKHKQLVEEITLVNIMAGSKESSWETACWKNNDSPALSEMMYELSQELNSSDKISKQTANTLLTGIIAQTERYKTKGTQPRTMHISAELLELGADLQLINENLARNRRPVEAPEPVAVVEKKAEAEVEATEHDVKLVKNKDKKKQVAAGRLYMSHGDAAEGVSYGEKAGQQKAAEAEYQLDKLNIDEEGNLRILSDDVEEEMPAAAAPAVAAASADEAPAQDPPAPIIDRGVMPAATVSRGVLNPSMPDESMALSSDAPADQSEPALAIAAENNLQSLSPQAQQPSIGEMVDKAATPAVTASPVAPSLNEKVDALSPVNANSSGDADSYIDSLMGDASTPAQAPVQPPVVPGGDVNPGQAMTVDNYLTQQADAQAANPQIQPGVPDASSLEPPYAPPTAPPLASMS